MRRFTDRDKPDRIVISPDDQPIYVRCETHTKDKRSRYYWLVVDRHGQPRRVGRWAQYEDAKAALNNYLHPDRQDDVA